jgi:LPPG:FO 2-phospho-L-lactate transferase
VIVVLTGGSGGATFVQGLAEVVPARELTLLVNTGDDLLWWGLHVSPDIDSITYALAGLLSRERGWGMEDESFRCLEMMQRYGAETWFQLGDRDLALHLTRTRMLAAGKTLSQATREITARLGIAATVLPATDDRVETIVSTAKGDLTFQEFFVRERWQVEVRGVRIEGAERARPAPGVLQAIAAAEAVVLAPSNPITSIGPILAVPGIREALRQTPARVVAVSPIVGGAAVSGPAGALMACQGLPVSAAGVAKAYRDFLNVLVMDTRDTGETAKVDALGVKAHCAATIMTSAEDKVALACAVLAAATTPDLASRRAAP